MILSQTERRGTEDEGSNRQISCVVAVNGCHPIVGLVPTSHMIYDSNGVHKMSVDELVCSET